jgi:hypothetical protein
MQKRLGSGFGSALGGIVAAAEAANKPIPPPSQPQPQPPTVEMEEEL